MRFSSLSLFAAVSLAALVAVSAQAAPQTANSLGTLKSKDEWRVGTIDSQQSPYCAMVNKYEQNVFLAFARDGDGYGSVALDFSSDTFSPDKDYEVTLTPGAGKATLFKAHASSERSVVVQVGKDDAFYSSLNKADALHVSMPLVNVSFILDPFGKSYQELIKCADQIGHAPKTAEAEVVDPSQSPLDVAVAKVQDGTDVASAAPVEKVSAAADRAERKLLASTSSAPSTSPAADKSPIPPGKTAQELEKEQLAAIRKRPALPAHKADTTLAAKSATSSTPLLIDKKAGTPSFDEKTVAKEPAKAEAAAEQVPVQMAAADVKAVETAGKAQDKNAALIAEKTAPVDKRLPVPGTKQAMRYAADQKALALEEERNSLKNQFKQALAFNARTSPDIEAEKAKRAALDAQVKQSEKAHAETEAKLKDTHGEKTQDGAVVATLQKDLEQSDKNTAAAQASAIDAAKTKKADKTVLAAAPAISMPPVMAETPPVAPVSARQMPAVPSKPVATETIGAPAIEKNKAAAFLDRIMAYHRTGAAPKAAPVVTPATPAVASVFAPAPKPAPAVAPAAPSEEELAFQSVLNAKPTEQPPVSASVPSVMPEPKLDSMLQAAADKNEPVENVTAMLDDKPSNISLAPQGISAPPEMPPSTLSGLTQLDASVGSMSLPPEKEEPAVVVNDSVLPPLLTPVPAPKTDAPKPDAMAAAPVLTPPPSMRRPSLEKIINSEVIKLTPPDKSSRVMSTAPSRASLIIDPSPAPAYAAVPGTTLKSLLDKAGLKNVSFVPVKSAPGEAVRQWQSGKLKGLYEQTAAGGNFKAAFESYLDRYRADCPGNLNVTIGEARTMRPGTVAPAAISCTLKNNSYSTSFVFIQDAGSFHAIAHTGHLDDAAAVKAVSDKIVAALSNAQRFSAPEPTVKNIIAAPSSPASGDPVSAAAPEALSDPSQVVRTKNPQASGTGKKPGRSGNAEANTLVIE